MGDSNKIETLQLVKLTHFLQHAYENVPYYRRVLKEGGIEPREVASLFDLNKLPVLTKEDVRKNSLSLMASNYGSRAGIRGRTGGSTGQPFSLLEMPTQEVRHGAP